jgi:ATP-dependent DNA helicase DinG
VSIEDFGEAGVLANSLKAFTPRAAQSKMAAAVVQTIQQQAVLVVEAGTGTGKTYAYLVPALRSGRKVVISTASKALQDQLYQRDLPAIAQAINFTGRVVVLKGRRNYLCRQRLEQHLSQAAQFEPAVVADLVHLRYWSSQTHSGAITDCATVSEESAAWSLATSSEDNCLGSECPHYQGCFVVKARQQALEADIVIVNHHLFFADRQVQTEHHATLIAPAEVMIIDEAHTLPEIAAYYCSDSLSSQQLTTVARDVIQGVQQELNEFMSLREGAEQLSHSVQQLQRTLGTTRHRAHWRQALQHEAIQQAVIELQAALAACHSLLGLVLKRSAPLDNAWERVTAYQATLQQLQQVDIVGYGYWYQANPWSFTIARTPLSVATSFQAIMNAQQAAWIFTSATLAVNQQLDHFCQQLGLRDPQTLLLSSPFHYHEQALLCIPRYLPSSQHPEGANQLVQLLHPLLKQSAGGCLVLCTAYQRMHDLAQAFQTLLGHPILVQGAASKSQLLAQFTQAGNTLLVATNSFWQGIDIPGQALSCLVIDKLPFTPPDDPLLQARSADCRLQGGDPFKDLQIPEAVIALKQGVGRLIRTSSDRGVLIICDDRLVSRPYGSLFLGSLPPMPRTRDLQQAIDFFLSTDALSRTLA